MIEEDKIASIKNVKLQLSIEFSLFLRSFVWLHTSTEEDKIAALSDTMTGTIHGTRQSLHGF
jgi:hypothetical protein